MPATNALTISTRYSSICWYQLLFTAFSDFQPQMAQNLLQCRLLANSCCLCSFSSIGMSTSLECIGSRQRTVLFEVWLHLFCSVTLKISNPNEEFSLTTSVVRHIPLMPLVPIFEFSQTKISMLQSQSRHIFLPK